LPKQLIRIVFILAAFAAYFTTKYIPRQASTVTESPSFYVSKAVDGDTLKLSNGDNIRLIGIDTPESRYNSKLERDARRSRKDIDSIIKMGKEASNFTRRLVGGKKVRLEFDVEKHDRYGRLLAYVYLEDGTFVNSRIIEEGYAQVMTIAPNVKYAQTFLKLEREARQKKKGLWKDNLEDKMF
jgi:Micrococcal nuclease (thermonuclease) homologs